MATIIALANQKGGVAKTTSAYNIAYCLSNKNHRTLLVDTDPQSSLTVYTGMEPYSLDKTICDVLAKHSSTNVAECIYELRENLDILPARPELSKLEKTLIAESGRETILSRALNPVKSYYDYIIIDTPPQLSTLTDNALFVSDYVIIPCTPEYLAYRGIKLLMDTITETNETFGKNLSVIGIVATRVKTVDKQGKEILEALEKEYNVIGIVKDTVTARKGIYDGMSASEASANSSVAKEYDKIADVILALK